MKQPETLEELQNELERIVEDEAQKRKQLQEAHRRYETEVAPVLYRLREYLGQLIVLLNDKRLQQSERTRHLCMPEVEYDLAQIGMRSLGTIRGQQQNYELVTSTEADRLADFCLYYRCIPERAVEMQHIELRHANDFKRRIAIQNVLKKYNLHYNCTEHTCQDNSVKVIFTLQPEVKIKLAFTGNPEGDSFKVVVTNIGVMTQQGQFGESCFPRVTPDQVGIEAIEALIRLIARQPHELFKYWEIDTTTVAVEPALGSIMPKEPLRKQTHNFDVFNIKNVLGQLQQSTQFSKGKQSPTESSKKRNETKESVAEHHRRAQAEHDKFMAELSKIHAFLEKKHSKNQSFFGWLTSMVSSNYKRNGC